MSVASQVFRVQTGEGSIVALVVGLTFVSMAAATIGERGIDALFFDRVGAQALPVMHLLQGGMTLIAMFALTETLGGSVIAMRTLGPADTRGGGGEGAGLASHRRWMGLPAAAVTVTKPGGPSVAPHGPVSAGALTRSSITCQTSLSSWFSFQMP
jgi:hypothetical protein